MLLKKIIFLLFIIIANFLLAQKKKKIDTVYVYEKVIVYDTVYVTKPIRLKQNGLLFSELKVEQPKFIRNVYKKEIEKQTAINKAIRKKIRTFEYGIEAGIGLKNSSWGKEISNNKQQFGENIGIWTSKRLTAVPLTFMFSADIYYWNSSFDLDANKEETYLDGFYFTEDHQPLLFQKFNNKHFEYAIQLKLFYEWKNIRPYVGVLVNRNIYKMQFLVPKNNVLDKLDDFKTTQNNLGFSFGLQYRIFKRFLVSVDYQQYEMKNVSLKNSSFDFDIFKTNNTFAERKINLGIAYTISK
ncbi:hypothetical protein SAMN05421664_2183 [Chryseobacterium soldanellicola]|uniref:Outer membrane protein beta-barrel domain-containing protein n=1 Tax=Chryseobacterium soldanellicola TaxID=311333 RepID=A0A1H1CY01_9FLAO|nr:hypothetical protein [Chryseobacterium soldanellicola]SDQ69020.1 hypothetical protein SAMN05421664_2183 [Chryseobacterium soldanellicola]